MGGTTTQLTVLAEETIGPAGGAQEKQTLLLHPDGGWSADCTCAKYEQEKKCGHRTAAIQKWGKEGKIPGVKAASAQAELPTNGNAVVVEATVMEQESAKSIARTDNTPRPAEFAAPAPKDSFPELENPRAMVTHERPAIPGLASADEWEKAVKLAKAFLESGFAPEHLQKEGAVLAAIQWGGELGLTPMESLRSIYVSHGRVGISSAAAFALCIRKVPGFRYKIVRRDESGSELTVIRTGQEAAAFRFTWDDAVRAQLTTGQNAHSYKKWPRNMLWARCLADMARAYCPDALGSAYVKEELDDIEPTTVTVSTPAPPDAPKAGEDVAAGFPSTAKA